jgi:DNA-binding LacI/PurR family transcriptional regulator
MVLPGLDNPIEREAAQYASRFLLDAGYDLMVVQHHHDPAIYARILRRLTQGMADGAIIIPGIVPDSSMEDELLGRGYPLVFLDRHPRGLRAPTVTTANAAAADTLASLLVEAGARSLVVDFRESNPVAEERRRGSLAAALRLGVPAALSEELDRSPGFLAGQDPIGFLHSSPRAFAGILKRDPPALLRERIFLGVFDAAADAPYLASETVVCIQDFEEMARRAVALILGACGGETLIREIHTVPAKEFLRGPF